MEDLNAEDETFFVVEEVSTIVKEAIEGVIGSNSYHHSRVNQWTSSVVENCLSQLSKLSKPFNNMHYYAEEWRWFANCLLMFLGQHNRWQLYSEVGE